MGVIEIKNIAVYPEYHGRGYGRRLIEFIENKYKNELSTICVGTGDSRLTIPFYKKLGFKRAYIIKNFFTENYERPIFEDGKMLTDMICLEKSLDDIL